MNICIDACFLIGLHDDRDQHHARATTPFAELFEEDSNNVAIVVWPVLYESVSTQLVKRRSHLYRFERTLRILRSQLKLEYVEDGEYRDGALEACFGELGKPPARYRPLSLTDRVLREVLQDPDVRVDAILTFNAGDFSDACRRLGRLLLS